MRGKKIFTVLGAMAAVATIAAPAITSAFAYTVKEGDTLNKIATENNISVEKLCELNGISNANQIWVGETIKVSDDDITEVSRLNGGIGKQGAAENAVTATTANISATLSTQLRDIFDAKWYAEKYPDVVDALGDSEDVLFAHFLRCGIWEGRQLNPTFNVNAYASSYSDLQEAFKNDGAAQQIVDYYSHYVNFGINEERYFTTIDRAVSAGIEVKNVATSGNVEVGEVIAVAQVPTPIEVAVENSVGISTEESSSIETTDEETEEVTESAFGLLVEAEFKQYESTVRSILATKNITIPAAPTDAKGYLSFCNSLFNTAADAAAEAGYIPELLADLRNAQIDHNKNVSGSLMDQMVNYPEGNKFIDAVNAYIAEAGSCPTDTEYLSKYAAALSAYTVANAYVGMEYFPYQFFATQEEATAKYESDLSDYLDSGIGMEPNESYYVVAKYESQDAYNAALDEINAGKPQMDDYYFSDDHREWLNNGENRIQGASLIGEFADLIYGVHGYAATEYWKNKFF